MDPPGIYNIYIRLLSSLGPPWELKLRELVPILAKKQHKTGKKNISGKDDI